MSWHGNRDTGEPEDSSPTGRAGQGERWYRRSVWLALRYHSISRSILLAKGEVVQQVARLSFFANPSIPSFQLHIVDSWAKGLSQVQGDLAFLNR